MFLKIIKGRNYKKFKLSHQTKINIGNSPYTLKKLKLKTTLASILINLACFIIYIKFGILQQQPYPRRAHFIVNCFENNM